MHHSPFIELHRPSGCGSGFGCLGPDNDLGARDEERIRFGETLHKAGGGNDSRGASRACGVVLYDAKCIGLEWTMYGQKESQDSERGIGTNTQYTSPFRAADSLYLFCLDAQSDTAAMTEPGTHVLAELCDRRVRRPPRLLDFKEN
ncbi:hypothetical protein HETIRDRAFT_117358 [Heterobasidion irregulare TC 32-1]|uniref:Uncharacterized protein n=1 Tax=Heterobasidion irregulare (strain TC 32-1) TaxID=747525 RepID=W4K0V1_HETIT|nr:uncharacterized protein HETIRDRAFT_117358 [Heterobasidion irregulare TC 32-1]ETW79422.1 hypothetical protein HETIRDRAFT_117358 [Heterobasidion irregulare TC 32-1]